MAEVLDLNKIFDDFEAKAPTVFTPYVEHSEVADAINVYFKGDADYSERLTEHVTLFRAIETKELVGFRIKGISGIVADAPNFIRVNHDGIELSVILLSFLGSADANQRTTLNELASKAKGMKLEKCS